MLFRKRGRKYTSIFLSLTLFTTLLPIGIGKVHAAAATPTLNGYQLGDHVKMEWGVEMEPSDVLNQTSFEPGQEIPNLYWSGIGNQSITSAPGGGNALKVTDTITNRTGNLINYPHKDSDWSINQYTGKSIPGGSTISITFRALSTGGNFSQLYFSAGTGWYKRGYTFNDSNGRLVKFGNSIDWNVPPNEFSAYVDGGIISIPDNTIMVLVSSHTQNYEYGVMYYHWDDTRKVFKRSSANSAPWAIPYPNGQTFTIVKEKFYTGEPVLRYGEGGVDFPVRQLSNDGKWTTYSLNAVLPRTDEYDFIKYGIKPRLFWQTNGSLYVDDVKFGHATRVNLYRDNNLIYDGYLSDYEDKTAVDHAAPHPVHNLGVSVVKRIPQITWAPSAGDNGTTYNYKIQGIAPSGASTMSDNLPVTVTRGLKGYSILVDTNPNSIPDNVVETTGTSFAWPHQVSSNFYVHVAAVDHQGNISTVVHKPYTDVIQPNLIINPSTTGWTSGNVTLTGAGSDNETGIQSIQLPDSSWVAGDSASYVTTANGSFSFATKDNAGNISSHVYQVSNIDKTGPDAPIISINPSGWTNDKVTVTLTHGSDPQSGVRKSQYKIGTSGAWKEYIVPFTVSTEGSTEIFAQTIDNVGNIGPQSTASTKVDKSGPASPTIILSDTNWTKDAVAFTIENGADELSGIAKSQYKIGSTGVWMDYDPPVSISFEGVTEVYARTLDQVGNVSPSVMSTIHIDKTAPSEPRITLSESSWTQKPVSFTIEGSVDVNAISYEYKIDNGAWTAGTNGTVTQYGVTTVTGRAKDGIGNVGSEIKKDIYVDNVNPTIAVSHVQDWTANDIDVTVDFNDTHSGVNANKRFYKITNSSTVPSSWDTATANSQAISINKEGVWYVHAKVEDTAGNAFQTVSKAFKVQRIPNMPSNVRVTQVTESTARVAFDLPGGSVYTDGYSYEVKNVNTGQVWMLPHPNNAIKDTALEGGKTYIYEVKAINHVGSSPVATITALTLPKAPDNVSIHQLGALYGEATASFNPVESATQYRIVARDTKGSGVFNQTVTDTVYQSIKGLQPGTQYTISVSAINASGEGSSRNAGFLSLPDAPNQFSTVQINEHDIQLHWNTVTSATYYSVFRDGLSIYGGPWNMALDTGLEAGTAYNYSLSALNATGLSALAELKNIMTLPTKIEVLTVSDPTTNSLRLNWNSVRGASEYVIEMDGKPYRTVPSGTNQLMVTGLQAGTSHAFEVLAVNKSGAGSRTKVTGMTIPSTAVNLYAESVGETSSVLKWDSVQGADKYRVFINGQTVEVGTNEWLAVGLSGSQTYSYSVQAGNAAGYGGVATKSFLTLPYAPNQVKVTDTTETTFGLKWDAVKTATSYNVTQNGKVVGTSTSSEFKATGLTAGTAYSFHLHAINATGEGKKSAFTWITKPNAPEVPKTVPSVYQAEISWATVPGAVQYVIENGGKELYRGKELTTKLTGLSDGETYNLTIRAENANGISSKEQAFTLLTIPKKPVKVTAKEVQKTQLTLDFTQTEVVGADRYIIERNGVEIGHVPASDKTYTDQGLKAGTKYTYGVRAVNASGSGESYQMEITTKTEAVSAGSLKVSPETNTAKVSWERVIGAASFQITNTVTGSVYSTSDSIATLPNLTAGTSYTFEVRAVNEDGIVSEPLSLKVLTKPAAPQTAMIDRVTDTTATLNLSKSGVKGSETFVIFRDGKEIKRLSSNESTYEDNELKPGTSYTYEVRTSNDSGMSDNAFTLKAKTLPKTVTTPAQAGKISTNSVVISWDAVTGAEQYRIIHGKSVVEVTYETSVTINNLESAMTYGEQLWIIPLNDAGEGKAIPVAPFETLPIIDGLKVETKPSMNSVFLNWSLPNPHETFVISYKGKEVYRGKDHQFELKRLEEGKVHLVSFHTENAKGKKSKTMTYPVLTKPNAPSKIGYGATPNSVVVSFPQPAVQGTDEYVIERKGAGNERVSVTAATYEILGLEPGETYTFEVKSANGSGLSDKGYMFTVTTLPANILVPPTTSNLGTGKHELSWDAVKGATGYKVYIGDKLVLTTTMSKVMLTGLESAKRYDNVRVVPFNKGGDGNAIAVPVFVTLPSSDFIVTAQSKGTNIIELNWALASQNEVFVIEHNRKEIYRGKARSYEWTGLNDGQTYTVNIWTENSNGVKSDVKIVTTLTKEESSNTSDWVDTDSKKPIEGTKKPEPEIKPDVKPDPIPELTKIRVYFEDIDRTFNKNQIILLAEQNVIHGVSATKFEPYRSITRAEFTALIVRLLKVETEGNSETGFTDVEAKDWFAPEIAAAVEHGFVSGIGGGKFTPDQLVTREQASKIMANVVRAMKQELRAGNKTFADQDRISTWAEEDVRFLAGMNMVMGYEDGTFRPVNHLNRAEAAALIYRMNEFMK
ncbi:fibronectin type III domain-containing protein [Paenibacillus agilis]|uniref:fibronectin type III domain-containing protein n=1 Tax=Paenibacillus agilis TaxID=3020863 RepID=UPI001649875A|nr:fibronectin type III domain-containing protein [Paenibacillus agilis]